MQPDDIMSEEVLGVAEAKKRFAELIDRVGRGESFVVSRRGRPAMALVPPGRARHRPAPVGLAAVAGALGDWEELGEVVEEIYRARRLSKDRKAPDFG